MTSNDAVGFGSTARAAFSVIGATCRALDVLYVMPRELCGVTGGDQTTWMGQACDDAALDAMQDY